MRTLSRHAHALPRPMYRACVLPAARRMSGAVYTSERLFIQHFLMHAPPASLLGCLMRASHAHACIPRASLPCSRTSNACLPSFCPCHAYAASYRAFTHLSPGTAIKRHAMTHAQRDDLPTVPLPLQIHLGTYRPSHIVPAYVHAWRTMTPCVVDSIGCPPASLQIHGGACQADQSDQGARWCGTLRTKEEREGGRAGSSPRLHAETEQGSEGGNSANTAQLPRG